MSTEIKLGEDRVELTRMFDAPRERVFAAWTEAEQVEKWWGCKDTESVKSTIDLRVHGTMTHKMSIRNVGEYEFVGTIEELVIPEKIVLSTRMAPVAEGMPETVSRMTVEFFERGEKTEVRLTQVGFPVPEFREHVSRGFNAAFDKLEKMLG